MTEAQTVPERSVMTGPGVTRESGCSIGKMKVCPLPEIMELVTRREPIRCFWTRMIFSLNDGGNRCGIRWTVDRPLSDSATIPFIRTAVPGRNRSRGRQKSGILVKFPGSFWRHLCCIPVGANSLSQKC